MKDFKVTVKGANSSISYTVYKTEKGAMRFGKKVANEAFYGEAVEIIVEAI
jgi:phosphoribosyl-ATP pyrophosphohydrolase